VGRKSRLKRERAEAEGAALDNLPAGSSRAPSTVAVVVTEAEPEVRRPAPRQRKAQAVGARVARVAVDDPTWEAFRELCGSTPASVRLGQLVAAEVQRARDPAPEPDAVAALWAIRSNVDELETFVRGIATRG
jgi:hypothetical protein